MSRFRKQPKRVVVSDETLVGDFTPEELRARLEVARREALSVAERYDHPEAAYYLIDDAQEQLISELEQ